MAVSRINEAGLNVNQYGNRNLIINGAMKVAQRGTQTNQTSGYTACDRWQFSESGASVITTTQDTDVPSAQGFANSLKIDVTTADTSVGAAEYAFLRTKLEGQDLQQLLYGTSSAKEITLSFWVKSSKTGIHVVELRHRDPSGGTNYNNQQYTISAADTWQNVTMTFVGQTTDAFDDDNNASLEIVYWLMAGSDFSGGTFVSNTWATSSNNRAAGQVNVMDSTSNNWYITGVQLEVGDTATDFEHRTFADELIRCQRYYEQQDGLSGTTIYGVGYNESTTIGKGMIPFKVTKRANPTVSILNAGHFCNVSTGTTHVASSLSFDGQAPFNTRYTCTSSSASLVDGGASNLQRFTGDAIIKIDAEL